MGAPQTRLSPSPSDVAHKMGVSVQHLMRSLPELLSMRDLLLKPQFKDAFPSQATGDACLMEGGIVHRGPATKGERTSPRAGYSSSGW